MFGELTTQLELQTEGLESNKVVFVLGSVTTTTLRKGQLVALHVLFPANLRSKSMLENTNPTNIVPPANR